MAVRRRRPLVPPPYPRRNRYIPRSSGLSKQIAVLGIVTHFFREVCYNSMKFIRSGLGDLHHQLHRCDFCQAPVKLIKQFGRVDGPARPGRPQGTARYLDLLAVWQQFKGTGLPVMLPTSKNSVRMGPGQTAVTEMCLRRSSSERPTAKEETYALDAE